MQFVATRGPDNNAEDYFINAYCAGNWTRGFARIRVELDKESRKEGVKFTRGRSESSGTMEIVKGKYNGCGCIYIEFDPCNDSKL